MPELRALQVSCHPRLSPTLTLHPLPLTLHPSPLTLHPSPLTLNLLPVTFHPSPPHLAGDEQGKEGEGEEGEDDSQLPGSDPAFR